MSWDLKMCPCKGGVLISESFLIRASLELGPNDLRGVVIILERFNLHRLQWSFGRTFADSKCYYMYGARNNIQ